MSSRSIAVWKHGIKTFAYWNLDRSGGFNPDLGLIGTHFDGTNCTLIHTFYVLSSIVYFSLFKKRGFFFSYFSLFSPSSLLISCLLSCLLLLSSLVFSYLVCLLLSVLSGWSTVPLLPSPLLTLTLTHGLVVLVHYVRWRGLCIQLRWGRRSCREEARVECKLMEKDGVSEQNKGAT